MCLSCMQKDHNVFDYCIHILTESKVIYLSASNYSQYIIMLKYTISMPLPKCVKESVEKNHSPESFHIHRDDGSTHDYCRKKGQRVVEHLKKQRTSLAHQALAFIFCSTY